MGRKRRMKLLLIATLLGLGLTIGVLACGDDDECQVAGENCSAAYREQNGMVSYEEKQNLTVRKLGEFNSTYIEAKAKRLEMETRLAELRKAAQRPETLEGSPMIAGNPVIQRLKGQQVELEVQRSKLLQAYKEKHPEVVKVQSQIDEVTRRIRQDVLPRRNTSPCMLSIAQSSLTVPTVVSSGSATTR